MLLANETQKARISTASFQMLIGSNVTQVFQNQGIGFTPGWDNFTSANTAKQLAALASTGATSISLVGRAWQTSLTASSFTATERTTDLNVLASVIDQAHALGLKVTLTPHVEVTTGGNRSYIDPANTAAWFANYTDLMVSYARVAQAHGVEMLSLGTEMAGVVTPATAGYWTSLISAVRGVYNGQLTYQADYFTAKDVTFWGQLDVISVDAYVPVSPNTTPTVAGIVQAWNTVSPDTWTAGQANYKSPVDFLRSLSLTYDKPVQLGELGYRNLDGTAMRPGDWQVAGATDQAEQKMAWEAFFQVFSKETSWFQGLNAWAWSSTPTTVGQTDYYFQNTAALGTIKDWYSGANNAKASVTLAGTVANDRLAGGVGNDTISGGPGHDLLLGADGNDILTGDGGMPAGANKLVILARGTPAGGVDALMQVLVNGAVVGTVSVPRASTSFSFDLPAGTALSSVRIAFTNDAVINREDRNLIVQQVSVNGVMLNAADAINTKVPGTLSLWSNGTITFDLSKRPDISNAALEGNDTLVGGTGADTLTGGGGVDTFVFARGSGHDVVTDFGYKGEADVLDIRDYLGIGSRPTVASVGSDTLLTFATGDTVRLSGVAPANLASTATGYVYTVAPTPSVQPLGAVEMVVTTVTTAVAMAAFRAQNAGAAWSYAAVDGTHHFEVRSGDRWSGDGSSNKERSEMYSPTSLQFGKTYHISFDLKVEAGPTNTAAWMTLMQLQSVLDPGDAGHSPLLALEMVGDKMRFVTRDSQTAIMTVDDSRYVRQYTDTAAITRDHWYDFDIQVTVNPLGGGHLKVVRDGVTLFEYNGPLGFNDIVGPYMKLGVYRDHANEAFAADFREVSVSQVTQVTVPVPVPVSIIPDAAPTWPTLDALVLAENLAAGTLVGTASAADSKQQALTYSLVDTAGGLFAVNAATGAITTTAALDYEAQNSYALVLRATSVAGLTADTTVTVGVTDVNEAPTSLAVSNVTLAEGLPAGTLVGTASGIDPEGKALAWSLVGAGGLPFAIDAATGAITATASLDYEAKTSYALSVRATDKGGLTLDKSVTIGVTDVNEAPVNLAVSNVAVAENLSAGTLVGRASASDPDGRALAWSLVGADGLPFAIDAGTGAITTTASLDYEAKSSYALTARATDKGGLTLDKSVTIGVTDVNEVPTTSHSTLNLAPIDLAVNNVAIAENLVAGTLVGTANATDPEGKTLIWSLVDGNGQPFAIDAAAGRITTTASLDYEAKSNYAMTIRATDAGGLTLDKSVTIGVTDVNEAPTSLAVNNVAIGENLAAGTLVGTAGAIDPDGKALAFSLVGADGLPFAINQATGAITTTASLDYEAKSAYALTVRGTDSGGLSLDKSVTIGITDVNEAPVGLAVSKLTIAESLAAGAVVGTASGIDPEGKALSWSLVGGNGQPFAIDAATGKITTTASLDFEVQKIHEIKVRATDAAGLWSEQPFKVLVQDVIESPVKGQLPLGLASFTETRQLAENPANGPGYAGVLGHAQMVETPEGLIYHLPYNPDGMIVLGADYTNPYGG